MNSQDLPALGEKSFEELKHFNQHGAEYWEAREIQPMLGYSQWRRFEDAINRAMISCEKSGNNPAYQFAGAGKLIGVVQDAMRRPFHAGMMGDAWIDTNSCKLYHSLILSANASVISLSSCRYFS